VAALDLLVLGDCNPDLLLRGGDVEPAFGQVERIVEQDSGLAVDDLVLDAPDPTGHDRARLPHRLRHREPEALREALLGDDVCPSLERVDDHGVLVSILHRQLRQVDPAAIDCYLAYGYVQAPRSIWRDVRKLPPAHTLSWRDGKVDLERYWRLDYSRKADAPLPELEEELRHQVGVAVRRRMIADVPLGALLSGGFLLYVTSYIFRNSEMDDPVGDALAGKRAAEEPRSITFTFRQQARPAAVSAPELDPQAAESSASIGIRQESAHRKRVGRTHQSVSTQPPASYVSRQTASVP